MYCGFQLFQENPEFRIVGKERVGKSPLMSWKADESFFRDRERVFRQGKKPEKFRCGCGVSTAFENDENLAPKK